MPRPDLERSTALYRALRRRVDPEEVSDAITALVSALVRVAAGAHLRGYGDLDALVTLVRRSWHAALAEAARDAAAELDG